MISAAFAIIRDDSDREFVRELFKRYEKLSYKIAWDILHNRADCEDAVQETFLRVIDNLEKIRCISCNKLPFYFVNIVRNVSINMLNKRNRHPAEDIDAHYNICSDVSIEEECLKRCTIEEIRAALNELSDRDCDILRLHLLGGLTQSETAELLDMDERSIRVYFHRAKNRLIKLLKERGFEDDI